MEHARDSSPSQPARFAIRYLAVEPAERDPALTFAQPPDALYLIHNKYWSFDLARARETIARRLGMKLESVKEFRGLQIFIYKE